MIFFKIFFRKPKFFQNLEFLALKLGAVRVLSGVANRAFKYECSIFCSFWDMALVFFSKIKLEKFEVLDPVVDCCEYSQKLQILRPNATVQLLLVFEM